MNERFEHKKSLGQHFLNSDVVPKWLAEAGNVNEQDTVLEIGPGTGALTRELLARAAKVIALEADKRAIEVLEKTFATEIASGQLQVHHHDVRELDLSTLGLKTGEYKVVANIPYYLSGYLFRSLLQNNIQPSTLVFLVQKEVAKRATSDRERGEKESLLSIAVKVFGEPEYVRTVTKGHFTPPPKVDSAIIAVRNISLENFKTLDPAIFFNLLHLGFGQKRKQLLGNLSQKLDREEIKAVFNTLGIREDVRAEDVEPAMWIKLATLLSQTEHSD